jgi:hypothetical protein
LGKKKILVVGHGKMFEALMGTGPDEKHKSYHNSIHLKNCQAVPLLLRNKKRFSTHNFKK